MLENTVVTNKLDAIINFIKTMNVCLIFFLKLMDLLKLGVMNVNMVNSLLNYGVK